MTEKPHIKSLGLEQARHWIQSHLPAADSRVDSPIPPSLYALDGFFFAVSCAPVPVSASQWLTDVLPLFTAGEATADSLNAVLSYQRHIERQIQQQHYPVPDVTDLDAIAEIEPGEKLNSWSLGFEAGFRHAQDYWKQLIPPELKSELDSQLFALTFFASPDKARQFLAKRDTQMRPEQLADQVLAQFPRAVDLHARLAISVGDIAQAKVDKKVGRNDPCPCGSGRKYKNCCLQ